MKFLLSQLSLRLRKSMVAPIAIFAALFFNVELGYAAIPDLPSIGFAPMQELGKELFITAVEADAHGFTNGRFELKGRRNIGIKISADKIFPRKFISFFVQHAAINNSAETLKDEAENMAVFASAIKGKLLRGDNIVFTGSEENNLTLVYLNNTELLRIDSKIFFEVILNSFTGAVPPSREFKEALTGIQKSKKAERQYRDLIAEPKRQATIASWLTPSIAMSDKVVSNIAIPNNSSALPENKNQDKIKASATATPEPTLAVANTPTPSPRQQVAKLDITKQNTNLRRDTQEKKAKRRDAPLLEEESSAIDAESILRTQIFTKKLLMLSKKEIFYPQRARKFNQEGSVLATVSIDRSGKIKKLKLVNKAQHPALNKAVIRAINKAAPFPPIPEDIKDREFSFIVPVTFSLD